MSHPTISIALLAVAFAAPCAVLAQNLPPAAAGAPATTATPALGASAGSPEAQPGAPGQRANPPGLTPTTPPPLRYDSDGNPLPPDQPKRGRRGGNFMPANPDATPILPGQSPSASSNAARGTNASTGGSGGGAKPRPHGGGMQRAFSSFQTKEELAAYREKVRAIKTVSECKTLMESTRKALEPKAKEQNKTIDVDIDKICNTGKERGRLTG